ncbi:MAG: PEGA domain-containing protein [Vicinamibacterales bacterium]
MATTTAASVRDHLDPWGFGRSGDAAEVTWTDSPRPGDPLDDADSDAAIAGDEPWTPAPHAPAAYAVDPRPSGPGFAADAVTPVPREMFGILALFALVILAQAVYIGYSLVGGSRDVSEMVVSSHPSGAQVLVDGRLEGTTPLAAFVAAGRHLIEVLGPGGAPEQFETDLVPGERWARHVELPGTPQRAATTGTLRVDTGAAAAQVLIDGELAGSTPYSRESLASGPHVVRVTFDHGRATERQITLAGGETLALVLDPPAARPAAPAGPVSGWLKIEAPFAVQVMEKGEVLGSSDADRLMLSAGGHVLELANAGLGFTASVKTVVSAGKVTPLVVDVPVAAVHVNASPWAEVLVDGRRVGETPLANLMLPLGPHKVVLRHPELGERVQSLVVRASGPNRLAADLRR